MGIIINQNSLLWLALKIGSGYLSSSYMSKNKKKKTCAKKAAQVKQKSKIMRGPLSNQATNCYSLMLIYVIYLTDRKSLYKKNKEISTESNPNPNPNFSFAC